MNGQLKLSTYRWLVTIVALAMAFAIGAASGGGVSVAASGGTTATAAQTTSVDSGGPGTDKAQLAAQAQASNAAFADTSSAPSAQGGPVTSGVNPGNSEAPTATCSVLPCFTDVDSGNTFYAFINRIYQQDLVTGYACGGALEPCDSHNRPYYRPAANVSRGQMSKFIDNARHLAGINITSGYVPINSLSNVANGAGLLGSATVADGAGVAAYGSGTGIDRTINGLNSGLYAHASGASNSVGLLASSANDNGMWIASDTPATWFGVYVAQAKGGLKIGDTNNALNRLYVAGPATILGTCTGCLMASIMQNTGSSDLHIGEIASLAGVATGAATVDTMPVAGASASGGAYSTAVMGVVGQKWILADTSAPAGSVASSGHYDSDATVIKPGEYFGVSTSGTASGVQVSAAGGAIHVGDLLVASDTPGVAMKADPKQIGFGSVIGKAMGNLESGTGTIAVLLTLK